MKKSEIKKQYRNQYLKLLLAVKAWCYNCNGYCADGVGNCDHNDCPLFMFRATVGDTKSNKFKAIFIEVKKINDGYRHTSPDEWNQIFDKEILALKKSSKKVNLTQKGGDENDR